MCSMIDVIVCIEVHATILDHNWTFVHVYRSIIYVYRNGVMGLSKYMAV